MLERARTDSGTRKVEIKTSGTAAMTSSGESNAKG
jgi:hypothetical protein